MKKSLLSIVLVAALLVLSLTGCTKQTEDNSITTDIVVIGAGGAGLAAAVEAKSNGANVIVIEKMPVVGGNTLRATGGMNAAETKFQQELKIEDSKDVFYEDIMKGGYDKNNPELVRILADNASDAIDWLTDLGADMSDVGRMGGSSFNRTHRPKGGAAVGPHIVKVLKEAATKNNIEVMLNTTVTDILVDSKKAINGVKAVDKDGQEITIKAKAVIIATGGFGSNSEMIVEYDADLKGFGTTNHPGATGDGIELAKKLGAELHQMEEIQTHPTVVPSNGYMITEAVRGNGAILVNREGKRFVSELETRDVVSNAILGQEGQTSFLVFDQSIRESLKAIENYISMGIVTEGATIEELAQKLSINEEQLAQTVETYNGFVQNKVDEEFQRPDMPRELSTAGFFAIEVAPAVHHTMGGIKIDTNASVLDSQNKAIANLYAAGEVTGGVHGGNRLGGNALSDLIVFGRIAGKAAAEAVK